MDNNIKNFWPDDTENEFFLSHETSLSDIIEICRLKWGQILDLNEIKISSEYIQTRCLTYDLYDSSDYTNFLRVSYNQ